MCKQSAHTKNWLLYSQVGGASTTRTTARLLSDWLVSVKEKELLKCGGTSAMRYSGSSGFHCSALFFCCSVIVGFFFFGDRNFARPFWARAPLFPVSGANVTWAPDIEKF